MRPEVFIARRYLVAKKSHQVINIISTISAIGIAIGTAALIIILSVYNGFDSLIKDMMGTIEPDLCITPAEGKVFVPDEDTFGWIEDAPDVETVCDILEEQVFISYDGKQRTATARGVDRTYEETSTLRNHLYEGKFELRFGDIPKASVGLGLASELGIRPHFRTPIEIWFPSRTRRVSMSNPAAALESINVWPSSLFTINNEVDSKLLILPIGKMRELLDYDKEVSALEIRFVPGTTPAQISAFQKALTRKIGETYLVKDRFQQNESLYKMMRYEKGAIFLILFFVVLITLFNIFGSLSMLLIEKREDMKTLESFGARNKTVRGIFILEGWFICLFGMAAGLIVGTGFAWAQQTFGFIGMPGNFLIDAYPVIISWTDVLLTAVGVSVSGLVISILPVMSFHRRQTR